MRGTKLEEEKRVHKGGRGKRAQKTLPSESFVVGSVFKLAQELTRWTVTETSLCHRS